jgi:hypothetical protein
VIGNDPAALNEEIAAVIERNVPDQIGVIVRLGFARVVVLLSECGVALCGL